MNFKLSIKEGVDYLTLDYEGFRQMMINRLKERLPEYTDYSETDMGVVLIELTAHGLDILSYYKDRQALECFLETARERRSVIMHCRNFGYTLDSATPSKFIQIFETDGTGFSVNRGDRFKVKTKAETGQSSVYFEVIGGFDPMSGEFSETFSVPSGAYGTEMQNGEYKYRAVVVQGQTITKEVVGYSDGTAYQKFYTHYTPALDYTPDVEFNEDVIYVYVGETQEAWTRVDNFLLSNATSKHFIYTVNEYGEGVIEFGNGVSGMIPEQNAKIQSTYRIGGGADTNVGANTIVEMDNKPASVIRTFNPSTAYVLGSDMETLEEAKVKAPASLRTLERAVTERDYADIGLQLSFVQSADSKYLELASECTKYGFPTSDAGRMKVWLLPKEATPDLDALYVSGDTINPDDFELTNAEVNEDGHLVLASEAKAVVITDSNAEDAKMDFTIMLTSVVGFSCVARDNGNGLGYKLSYADGAGLSLSVGNTVVASNNTVSLQADTFYTFSISCRENGVSVLMGNELILQYIDDRNTYTSGKAVFYTPENGGAILSAVGLYDYSSTVVYISSDNKDYIKTYYDERRMIGQQVDIYPANIEWVAPIIKCSRNTNYTAETVIGNVKSKLIELMSLGKYDLEKDLIWSDIVRAITDEDTGAVGLRSATFVERSADGKYYIQEDIPYKLGYVFALNETAMEVIMD